jgi:small redox-active disulfide protein 2
MDSNTVTQIMVAGQKTGIIGLEEILEEIVQEMSGRPDDEIKGALLKRFSKKNYIPEKIRQDYAKAFYREYKKYMGEQTDEPESTGLVIQVLGPGCPNCERLGREVMELMVEMNLPADFEHVRDTAEIGRFGVMGMPALVINGKVKAVGNVPSKSKIRNWLEEAVKLKS